MRTLASTRAFTFIPGFRAESDSRARSPSFSLQNRRLLSPQTLGPLRKWEKKRARRVFILRRPLERPGHGRPPLERPSSGWRAARPQAILLYPLEPWLERPKSASTLGGFQQPHPNDFPDFSSDTKP
ncbi:hypothetical protein Nepgr_018791 [Nepenthes gracilis]|uniref:Uncharacterized protein n=1 Tax=Nepenthes gracilis TaxID=150966 RepID=A0AAD3XUL6_NEPGR|nr:hypothetical protein Nepgr_018791 [Nepenthes gracilis]